MSKDSKNITISDVASLAGVARGTVDRVVYNRGGVSQENIRKVREAIKALDYKPNLAASALASKKTFKIACLIPEFEVGDYWCTVQKGFVDGARSVETHRVEADFYYFNPDDIDSYRRACDSILLQKPSGVIMNVIFETELIKFAGSLTQAGIPYAFVDRKVDELDYMLYYGVDSWDAGYLGAYLLTHREQVNDVGLIRLSRRNGADPNRLRRDGFLRYLREHVPDCRVHSVFIPTDDPRQCNEVLESFCAKHPEIHHLAMANSRIHLISDFLRTHPDPYRSVVGYEDLAKNIKAIDEGLVEFLVTRRASMQSYLAISEMARCLISHSAPAKRDNYMHMDILSRFNLRDYEK